MGKINCYSYNGDELNLEKFETKKGKRIEISMTGDSVILDEERIEKLIVILSEVLDERS